MTAALEEVIHFNCTWCGMSLTVPMRMAGISGPCPKCGNNITSPQSSPGKVLPAQAISVGGGILPATSSLDHPAAPAQTAPSSAGQNGNGNGNHHSLADPKLSVNNLLGAPPAGSLLPQPGSSNRVAPMPSLRPLSAALTGNDISGGSSLTREAGSHATRKRRGALIGALLMITLALAGAGFFFKDQVSLFWKQAQLKWKSNDRVETVLATPSPLSTGPQQIPANTDTTSAAINPNEPTVNPPAIVGTHQSIPGPNLPVPTPAIGQLEPAVKPTTPETGLSPLPSAPNPSVNPNDHTEPLNKINIDPDSRTIKKALPVVDDPPLPSQSNSNPLIEVPGVRNNTTGKVDSIQGEDKIFVSATPDAQPAANILKQFFSAKKWQDRLEFTQAPEKMRPLMERYYGANNDGPLRITRIELIRHDRAPEMGSPHCVFQVSGPTLEQPVPVMVESSDNGWKVDWLTFTEFKDRLLLLFLKSWSEEPGRFHVMMRRTHYFDEDVPDLDKKYCFELTPPEPGLSGFVFVPKGSPLARELDRSLGWEITNVAAVVELQWRKQERYQWVEMTAVPQYNWRGPESAKAAAPISSNEFASPAVIEKSKPFEEAMTPPTRPRGIKN